MAWKKSMSSRATAPTTIRPLPAADKFIARFRTRRRISRFSPACARRKFLRASTATVRQTTFTTRSPITLENGALVSLASTGATPLAERNYEVRVFGSKAILQLELWRGTMTMIDFADKRTEFKPLAKNEIYPAQSPALNFIDAILGNSANGSPGELGLASMEIIEAACESAQTGRNEKIRPIHAKVGNASEKSAIPKAACSNSARMSSPVHLTGIAWDHSRALPPLVATAQRYEETHPGIRIHWQKRTLDEFGHAPMDVLAQKFDLIVIDHPWAGFCFEKNLVLDLQPLAPAAALAELKKNSIGATFDSYVYQGQLLALAD